MCEYGKYTLSNKEKLILVGVSVISSLSIGFLFYNTVIFVLLSPLVFFLLSKPLKEKLRDRRLRSLRDQFRDVLYGFSTSFATGMHMEEAMENSAHQIAEVYGEHADMAEELFYMIRRVKEAGDSEVDLWNNLAKRSDIEDIRDFASVFSACRDAGGNLVAAVDRASNLIIDKINIENEMRLMFSQKKMEGHMMGLMPIVMILFLRLSSPSYLDVMYESLVGRILMTMSLVGVMVAAYLTDRITRVEI